MSFLGHSVDSPPPKPHRLLCIFNPSFLRPLPSFHCSFLPPLLFFFLQVKAASGVSRQFPKWASLPYGRFCHVFVLNLPPHRCCAGFFLPENFLTFPPKLTPECDDLIHFPRSCSFFPPSRQITLFFFSRSLSRGPFFFISGYLRPVFFYLECPSPTPPFPPKMFPSAGLFLPSTAWLHLIWFKTPIPRNYFSPARRIIITFKPIPLFFTLWMVAFREAEFRPPPLGSPQEVFSQNHSFFTKKLRIMDRPSPFWYGMTPPDDSSSCFFLGE